MRRAKKRRAGGNRSSAVSAAPRAPRARRLVPRKAPARKSVTRVAAVAPGLREVPGVAQAEVEALTGDRVQALRRVADENFTLADASRPHAQRERLHTSVFDRQRTSGTAARGGAEGGEELVSRYRGQLARPLGA